MAEQETEQQIIEDVALDAAQMQIVTTEPKLTRRFEIQLYNEDIDDNTGATKLVYAPSEKPIIVSVADKQELQQALKIYKDCGQVPKITREVDPPTKADLDKFAVKLKAYHDYKSKKISAYEAYQLMTGQTPLVQEQSIEQPIQRQISLPTLPKAKVAHTAQSYPAKLPPKYFKIGDMELKEDNGVMYQKQFIPLTDVEASNIRIVDNKTNRVMNLNGKHIEMKKWIMVENQNQNDQDTLEENLK